MINVPVEAIAPTRELAAHGVHGPIIMHPHHAMTEMPEVQMKADLLFPPLAFDSPYPDLVRTSATTKLGEYLAARRPVIAHAPADSFISWYFREHKYAVVVDHLDRALLARSIEQLVGDKSLDKQLGVRVWERARADFGIRDARARFWDLVGRGKNKIERA